MRFTCVCKVILIVGWGLMFFASAGAQSVQLSTPLHYIPFSPSTPLQTWECSGTQLGRTDEVEFLDTSGSVVGYVDCNGIIHGSGIGSVPWNSITNPVGSLTLDMGGSYSTTFNYPGSGLQWEWQNTISATSVSGSNSPIISLVGQWWDGSASANDSWNLYSIISINGSSQWYSRLYFDHTGATLGYVDVPGLTDEALSPSECVQTDANNFLTTTGAACGAGYVELNPSATQTIVNPSGVDLYIEGTGAEEVTRFQSTTTGDLLRIFDPAVGLGVLFSGVNYTTDFRGIQFDLVGNTSTGSVGSVAVYGDMTEGGLYDGVGVYGLANSPTSGGGSDSGPVYSGVEGVGTGTGLVYGLFGVATDIGITGGASTLSGVNANGESTTNVGGPEIYGGSFGATYYGTTGPANLLIGSIFGIGNNSTGTVDEADGLKVYSAANGGGGIITVNYGIYIGAQTAGASNYGVYTAGAGLNDFGDGVSAGIKTLAEITGAGPIDGYMYNCSDCDTPITEGATCTAAGDHAGAGAWVQRGVVLCF